MSLPRHLFTPAFRQQHLGRSFAVLVGIMVFIASFITAAEAALLTLGYVWGQKIETRLTVEIPAVGDETATPQAERVQQATQILRAMPGVGHVTPLSDDEVARLLAPWFTDKDLLKTLPLPTLIDVECNQNAIVTPEQIQTEVRKTVSDAHIDDHGAWTEDLGRLIRGLAMIGGVTLILTGMTLMIAVALMCRAVMAAEYETIALLHLLGADDRDIARHFKLQAEQIAWRAAGIGFLCAMLVTGALLYAARHSADLSTLGIRHWAALGAAVVFVPICAIGIVAQSARASVMRMLKFFP